MEGERGRGVETQERGRTEKIHSFSITKIYIGVHVHKIL